MQQFAGNMLQVQNSDGKKFLVMSQSAYQSLTPEQILNIEKYSEIIYSDLETIETNEEVVQDVCWLRFFWRRNKCKIILKGAKKCLFLFQN